ncbi:MAG: CinA family nicotinamide mononucleotide deamidase-related protein [Chloroflexota bacterium]
MKAEIITSGTELLLGEVTDVNTPFLAGQLAALGIDLYYSSTVGDNFQRFSGVLRQAWERSDLVIITGGLGPTQGDITREVIAGMLGEKIRVDADLKKELVAFFARRGLEMPENNIKQATVIPSAVALRNAAGTAPGWWVEKEGRIIVTMPGPPAEMQEMWHRHVLPRLREKSGAVILSRMLKTWGLSEGKVDELVTPYLGSANPTLALYARPDGINLRITAKAATEAEAGAMLAARERDVREILKHHVWGADAATLEGVVGKLLCDRKLSLAVSESLTGGRLTSSLSGTPEVAGCFKGGIVLPTDASRVGNESAAAMARSARLQFGADIGLAIDGFYHDAPGAPRGSAFIAVDMEKDSHTSEAPGLPGRVPLRISRTINHALIYLRDFIEGLPE